MIRALAFSALFSTPLTVNGVFSSHLIKVQSSKLFFSSPTSPSSLGDNFDKTSTIFSIENAAEPYGYLASVHLAQKLATVPERKAFIESVVIGNKGPEWTFGIFDDLHRNLCSGFYDSLQGQAQFATDAIGYLASLWPPEEFEVVQVLIDNILENARDDLYESLIQENLPVPEEVELEYGDSGQGLTAEVDLARRVAAFQLLCVIRFVRVGLVVPDSTLGPMLPGALS